MPAAKAWLADEGYDPVYGARPLKRVIQRSAAGPAGRDAAGGRHAGWLDREGHGRGGRADHRRPGCRPAGASGRGSGGSLRKRAARAALFHFERSGPHCYPWGGFIQGCGNSCGPFPRLPSFSWPSRPPVCPPRPCLPRVPRPSRSAPRRRFSRRCCCGRSWHSPIGVTRRAGSSAPRWTWTSTRWARKRRSAASTPTPRGRRSSAGIGKVAGDGGSRAIWRKCGAMRFGPVRRRRSSRG